MTRTLIAACILALALAGSGSAQIAASSSEISAHLTKSQLKQMLRDAHTPEQYSTLASYYDAQEKSYLQQAADEKKEWERRSQNVQGVLAKYPRPVDSARNLYEYYMYKASESASLKAKYSQLAVGGSGSMQQP